MDSSLRCSRLSNCHLLGPPCKMNNIVLCFVERNFEATESIINRRQSKVNEEAKRVQKLFCIDEEEARELGE